jgi:hypothetical protein
MSDDLKDFVCAEGNEDIWAAVMARLLEPAQEPGQDEADISPENG